VGDIESVLILFAAGVVSGIINVMAGGGSTITLPALIFLGLDGTDANGTNRIAVLVQSIVAISSFRSEKYSSFKLSFKMGLFTLPGAILGAIAASNIKGETFEKILGVVMIGVIITLLIPRKKINELNNIERIPLLVYLSMFAIGFYGGFIQVGVGFLLMAALAYLLKESLVLVNVHKVFITFLFTIPAVIVFILNDNIIWFYGLSLAAGNGVGAWWSAKISIKKGEKIIKPVLIISIFIMALKLLGVF